MKQILIILTFLLLPSDCFATGWNDYVLDIGDGYRVFRGNVMDVCISKADYGLILCPEDYEAVGPVIQYISTPKYIFTKNYGRKARNMFDGDTYQEIDNSKSFYFIIVKGNDKVLGPMSDNDFLSRSEVASLESLNWKAPKNPNFWRPLLGTIMFLAMGILFLGAKYFWVTVPLIIGFILLIRYRITKNKTQQHT